MLVKFLCIITVLFFTSSQAISQSSNYSNINVRNRVQLEIPSDWTINDLENREKVRDLTKQMIPQGSFHLASLSVSSFPSPSKMWIRVSFLPLDPAIYQSEIKLELKKNESQLTKELAEMWQQEAPSMWSGLAKYGVKEVGRPSFSYTQLGGQIALVISYSRTSPGEASKIVRVFQYHVVLGSEKALITLSYVDGDPQILSKYDHIKSSFSIR